MQEGIDVGSPDFAWTALHPELGTANSPFPDSNPYGVLATAGRVFVTDAGSNLLNEVLANGTVRALAYFPNNTIAHATPTCVAQGPDEALYVGTLGLVDSLVFGPSAKVYRVVPSALTESPTFLTSADVWASGLWPINGCAFGADGSFYASSLITSPTFSGGDVVKIHWDDPSIHDSLTNQTLPFAAGVAVSKNGTVYAVGGTVFSGGGFVVRLDNK